MFYFYLFFKFYLHCICNITLTVHHSHYNACTDKTGPKSTQNTPHYYFTSITYKVLFYITYLQCTILPTYKHRLLYTTLPTCNALRNSTYNGLYHLHALLTIHGIAYLEYITLLTYNILTYKHLHLVSLLTGRKRTSSERLASILITLRQTTSIWSLPTNSSSLK